VSRFTTIPSVYLRGSLNRDDFPLPYTMSASLDPNRIPVDFWTGLGIAPRPSFDLVVTVAIDLGAQDTEGPPVTDRDLEISLIPVGPKPNVVVHSIGGTVFNAAGAPISGATITVSNIAFSQIQATDVEGHYRFDDLTAALYQLRAAATGLTAQVKMVNVPRKVGDPDFDFVLS
jgi:hypothetical protein